VAGGLFKSVIFGLLIAGSGCLCGLRTGEGASAVGHSATRAVVSSIIMIVIADGIFAVLFYKLGI
jgi:phospholipid/cholesterol/gamma-HCH transport system permease protein